MVKGSSRFGRLPDQARGFALVELIISTAIFSTLSAALLMAFISLKKNYIATTDFAVNHADQMRISDYLAMDFRRAIKLDTPKENDVTVYIPCYYDNAVDLNPRTPTLDGHGGIYYAAQDCSVKVRYYLQGSVIYRDEAGAPKQPMAIASDVQDFKVIPKDLDKVITTKITFNPTFSSLNGATEKREATAFHNTTLLRNNRGVY
jgi:prepilin-type N-terminal cleavage/methylation domain-containing protein